MHDVPAKIVDEDKSPQESVTNEIIAWKWNFTIPRLVAQQERTIHLYLDLFFNKRFGSKEWWIGFCEFGLSSKPELWSLPDTTDMLVQTSKSAMHTRDYDFFSLIHFNLTNWRQFFMRLPAYWW